jgi:hypothetical protein
MNARRLLSTRTRRLLAVAAGTAAVVGGTLSARPAVGATPDTFHTCNTGSSSKNVNTCMNVNGSFQFVQSAVASAHVVTTERTLKVCMYNPANNLIGCDPGGFLDTKPTKSVSFTWAPDRDVAPGAYCAVTQRQNADGSATVIGEACVTVDPNPKSAHGV